MSPRSVPPVLSPPRLAAKTLDHAGGGGCPCPAWSIRTLREEERPALREFFLALSAGARHMRFHAPMPRYPSTAWAALERTQRGHAEVALAWAGQVPVGHVQWTRVAERDADLAVVVADAWAGHGLATDLVARAARSARLAGMTSLRCTIHPDNTAARRLAARLGGTAGRGGYDWHLPIDRLLAAAARRRSGAPLLELSA